MIKQKHDKDCLQCCLSEILDMPYEKIPNFYKEYVKSVDTANTMFDEWLRELGLLRFYATITDLQSVPYCSGSVRFLGELKKDDRKFSHAVVLWVEDNKLYMEDPLAKSDYTLDDLCGVEVYLPIKR